MRTASGVAEEAAERSVAATAALLAAHLDASPLFVDLRDAREVGLGAVFRFRDAEYLEHLGADGHRYALRVRLFEAQPHVLIREARRETEVERARQHGARELVLRGAVAAAADVDDVAH